MLLLVAELINFQQLNAQHTLVPILFWVIFQTTDMYAETDTKKIHITGFRSAEIVYQSLLSFFIPPADIPQCKVVWLIWRLGTTNFCNVTTCICRWCSFRSRSLSCRRFEFSCCSCTIFDFAMWMSSFMSVLAVCRPSSFCWRFVTVALSVDTVAVMTHLHTR